MLESPESRETRARGALIGVIVLFALGVAVMAALGLYAFIWKTAIIPLLLLAALLSRRLDRFIDDWAIYLALVVLFDFCRGLVFALVTRFQLPVRMGYAIEGERLLTGGHLGPNLLQHVRDALPSPGVLDRLLTVVHSSHFAFFLLFGLAVWLLRGEDFRRYAIAVLAVIYTGLLVYLLVPTVPPWMAANQFGVIPAIQHISARIYNAEIPTLQRAFDVNPIAAMPSLHAALPTLCTLIAFHHFGYRAAGMLIYTLLIFFSIVYLGEHYLIDVAAGVLLAAAVYVCIYRYGLLSSWRSWPRVRVSPILLSALLITMAEGIGRVTAAIERPFAVTRSFVDRELAGKTPLAPFYRGQIAYEAGDFPTAQREFARAAAVLEDATKRAHVTVWAARSAYRAGDYPTAIDTLQRIPRNDRDLNAQLLLAVSYLQDGRERSGLALLEDLRREYPNDPEPVYWAIRHRYLHHEATREDVTEAIGRMETLPDHGKARRLSGALRALIRGDA